MSQTLQSDPPDTEQSLRRPGTRISADTKGMDREMISLLPGPVALRPEVVRAFTEPLLYHRSEQFLQLYERVRHRLSACVGDVPVGIFVGSGTLANEAVAATLSADPKRDNGLVLVSGEFGLRLQRQAERWQLRPRILTWAWGQAWDLDQVERQLREMPPGGWIWGVHHETSTGVQNDLSGLVELAKTYGQRVCLDAVSSLGTIDIDLSDVYLTSGTSGKALGSYPGLAFVFADPSRLQHLNPGVIPGYLDIKTTLSTEGPRFTVPSPLIRALDVALEPLAEAIRREQRYSQLRELGRRLRSRLRRMGIKLLADDSISNPSIATFAPPGTLSSKEFIEQCEQVGYQIAGQSGYLAERNLVQISLMGHISQSQLDPLLDLWEEALIP